jgi:hypothetical protein
MKTLGAFVDHSGKGVFEFVLDGTVGIAELPLARLTHVESFGRRVDDGFKYPAVPISTHDETTV